MIILLVILFVFITAAAVMAIEGKTLRSSLISLGAVGAGTSLIFLLLRAPGLAMAQLVFMFLGFIILMRGIIAMNLSTINEGHKLFGLAIGIIMLIIIFIFGVEVMGDLPRFGQPLPGEVRETVSRIMRKYRGCDTLGQVAALFTAILGALAILRKKK